MVTKRRAQDTTIATTRQQYECGSSSHSDLWLATASHERDSVSVRCSVDACLGKLLYSFRTRVF